MGEKELGRALLDLDAQKLAGVADAREQTWHILERDRRRVWWLTALTIALWTAASLLVLGMLVGLALLMPLQAKLHDEEQLARIGLKPPELKARGSTPGDDDQAKAPRLTPQMREDAKLKAQITFQMITVGIAFSVGVLGLAALATVFLVLATRRATLRQINASLMEISQQLKELRQPQPPSA